MATGITISNIFQSESGNVPASQLDTNFGQLASAFNSLLTYANYYVDVGAVNAISITVPSPLVLAYVAGLPLQIKVSNTNTGATTVNVNGLGAVSLVYPGTAGALSAGQLIAGGIYSVMYDGTDFQFLGSISATGGVTSVNAGTGISVNQSTGNVTVTNTGATSLAAGSGISLSGSTGAITVTNSGATSLAAGTGISLSGATGAITITNSGVDSLVAGTGIAISSGTGSVSVSTTASGSGTVYYKGTNTSRASTTVLAVDPDLTITLAAGYFSYELCLFFASTSASNGGMQIAVELAEHNSTVRDDFWKHRWCCCIRGNEYAWSVLRMRAPALSNFSGVTHPYDWLVIKGTVNASSGNVLALFWAQTTSSAGNAELMAGSYLSVTAASDV